METTLVTHHLAYDDFYSLDNLVEICSACHSRTHMLKKKIWEMCDKFYTEIANEINEQIKNNKRFAFTDKLVMLTLDSLVKEGVLGSAVVNAIYKEGDADEQEDND